MLCGRSEDSGEIYMNSLQTRSGCVDRERQTGFKLVLALRSGPYDAEEGSKIDIEI